jgi:cysteine desulfurase
VGMAAALRHATANLDARAEELTVLRDQLITRVQEILPDAVSNGPVGAARLPGNAHFTFPGCEGDSLLMLLDAAGIECSTGSACTAGVARPSHVLTAMGVDPATARGSLRFSLGHTSTAGDVEALIAALPQVVERARAAGLAGVGARGGNR